MLNYARVLTRKSEIGKTELLKTLFAVGFCFSCAVAVTSAQKNAPPCSTLTYEDKNQVTPNSITLKTVSGRVFDHPSKGQSQPVSSVCLALFEETGHTLVAITTADEEGWFRFKEVPKGKYRLVVKDVYHIFCPANIPVEIEGRATRRKKVAIYMLSRRIDQCSFGKVM